MDLLNKLKEDLLHPLTIDPNEDKIRYRVSNDVEIAIQLGFCYLREYHGPVARMWLIWIRSSIHVLISGCSHNIKPPILKEARELRSMLLKGAIIFLISELEKGSFPFSLYRPKDEWVAVVNRIKDEVRKIPLLLKQRELLCLLLMKLHSRSYHSPI